MPRDGAGNYTLPAGNPVVSGEIITPTWANPTMTDIAQALTDSLDRQGRGGMLVAFEFSDGSEANPGITWGTEPSTGFYRAGAADQRATVGSQDSTRWVSGDFGFEIWGGGVWSKPLVPPSTVTVTGTWTFSNTIVGRTDGNIWEAQATVVPTGNWNWTGVTPRIGGVNIATLNDISAPPDLDDYTRWNQSETITSIWVFDEVIQGATDGNLVSGDLADYTQTDVAETITAAWILPTTVKVKDSQGTNLEVAYRNPSEFALVGGNSTAQSQEGRIGVYTGAAGNYNVGILVKGTNITLKHRGTVGDLITLVENSVTIIWMDGEGATPLTGNRTVTSNNVVHLNWEETNVVTIWGNGLA